MWGTGKATGLQASTPSEHGTRGQHVLIVGGTGRTGRRLVQKLCDDPSISEVTAVVRDPVKAQLVFGPEHDNERLDGKVNIVEGDLTDVGAWASQLQGVRRARAPFSKVARENAERWR